MTPVLKKLNWLSFWCRYRLEKKYGVICFSQTGEDGILNSICANTGFYIDVGANHPIKYSNTHLLNRRGWRGINIDPNPGTKKLFDKYRPYDLNLELAISSKKQKKYLYIFEESCYNTFKMTNVSSVCKKKASKLLGKHYVQTFPLSEVCSKFLIPKQKIGLLNIDTEGMDEEVLESHNWEMFPPELIVIEHLHKNIKKNTDTLKILKANNYKNIAKTPFSSIFRREK